MNSTLTFRVDPDVKKQAMDYANQIGIPLSCLMNAFLIRFVADGKVPFSLEVPKGAALAASAFAEQAQQTADDEVMQVSARLAARNSEAYKILAQ